MDYAGFEPVHRVIAAAVVDGVPIEPTLAAEICRLRAVDGPAIEAIVDPPWLDDAVDEAVFVDQRQVEKREQEHFDQAIGQLERFVEDKVLVSRRERARIAESYAQREIAAIRSSGRALARGSRRRSSGSQRGTRRWSAGSTLWTPGKMRSTENGGTNTTSFDIGRPK